MLKKFEELNRTIDKLNTEKTKADAQKEVWEKKLKESIQRYKEVYGVDLSGESFGVIKAKLTKEVEQVESKTVAEYEKAQKIVSLIQSGDIKGAWKEMGVETEEDKALENFLKAEEEAQNSEQEVLQGVEDVISELEDSDFLGAEVSDEEIEDNGDFYVDEDDEEEVPVKKEEVKKPVFSPISFDDEDDDDFIAQPTEDSGKSTGIVIDDDEDDEDSYGGFGDILSGSKFSF